MEAVMGVIREKMRITEIMIMGLVVVMLLAASAPNVHAPSSAPAHTAAMAR